MLLVIAQAGYAEQITIAEFLSKADPNTTYRLTGTVQNIDKMFQLVQQALDQMVALLKKPELTEADMMRSYNQEDAINALRGQLRELNIGGGVVERSATATPTSSTSILPTSTPIRPRATIPSVSWARRSSSTMVARW